MSRLAVITCHYNWSQFDMPARNLHRFLRQMARYRVAVFGVELFLKGHVPEMSGDPNWRCIQVSEKAILWQKEALLNMAEKLVPPQFDVVAAIDADVEFSNVNWERDTLRAMQFHPVVQIFSTAKWTDRRGAIIRQRAAVTKDGLDMTNWTTHPGFAWAFTRELWNQMGGWYDLAPMGAGDTLLCVALQKRDLPRKWMEHAYAYLGPLNEADFDRWVAKVKDAMNGYSYGYVPGDLIHEWHGDLIHRNYHRRHEWIRGLNNKRHVRRTRAGYLEWTMWAPAKLRADMVNYFAMRDEDGKTQPEQILSTAKK
jgi:hypothetical protein